jgi:2-polyprenyl-6-methoxyphenol hydroxylase-like FAD-dependent oxidoreductase
MAARPRASRATRQSVPTNDAALMTPSDPSVLIVGAGPVGLALSIALGRRGVRCEVLERRTGDEPLHPTANHLGIRQMEVLREWGLEDRVVTSGRPTELPDRRYWMDRLDGRVLYEIERHRGGPPAPLPHSPTREAWISKGSFDPVLLDTARSLPEVDVRFATGVVGLEPEPDGVTVIVDGIDGPGSRRADFVVACDGVGSTVRTLLGIDATRIRPGIVLQSVWFTAPELADSLPPGGLHYSIVDPGGMLVALDRPGEWRIHVPAFGETAPMTDPQGAALVRDATGRPDLELTVHSCAPWELSVTLADRWRDGRVLLAGDAAKAGTPFGGLGMGFGLLDAHNLAWKLDAVLAGWGGDRLLDSYGTERRAAAVRLLTYQGAVLDADPPHLDSRLVPPMAGPEVLDDGAEGDAAREAYRLALAAHNEDHYDNVGIDVDQRYDDSAVVIGDGAPEPGWATGSYTPRVRAGHRFPHADLGGGRSTLDLFGDSFVLLTSEAANASVTSALADAATARSVPLSIHPLDRETNSGGPPFVLVRPDGHVAWAGDVLPESADQMISTVSGMLAPR